MPRLNGVRLGCLLVEEVLVCPIGSGSGWRLQAVSCGASAATACCPPIATSAERQTSATAAGFIPLVTLDNVRVTRKLYKLDLQKPDTEQKEEEDGEAEESPGPVYAATEVQPGAEIDSSALYLDEVVVSGENGVRYGAVDIPLPSGADVEAAPWGMKISGPGFGGEAAEDGQDQTQSQPLELENTEYQAFLHRYTVPVEALNGDARFLHLLRFSNAGNSSLAGRAILRCTIPASKRCKPGQPIHSRSDKR